MNLEKLFDELSFFAETGSVGMPRFFLEGLSPVIQKFFNPRVGRLFSRQGSFLFILIILVCDGWVTVG